ncbi:MAG: Gfo/Idh/MocA family oxidoreductase [Chloroflexota bacterium]|nr:Gfo/Idh/MocA family oxidoreductase [Chloroflexota bacterium]
MKTYRVGIVGLSWITSEPAKAGSHPVLGNAVPHSHLSALAAIPAVTVVAGCDIVPEACDRFTGNWGGTWPGLRSYTDYEAMLRDEELDVVCVATPDHLHGAVVRAAACSGVRGIFCEKPISTDLDDVDAMIEAIERHGVIVNVNNTRRWGLPYVAAREAIRAGAVGRLSQVSIHFGGARAMLWRNHAHFLDLCSYFAEGDPAWAMAELEPGFEDYGIRYKGDGGRSPEFEPGVNAYIAYDNGVRAFLGGMKSSTPQVSVDLFGSDARIHANDGSAVILRQTEDGLATIPIVPKGSMQGMQAGIVDLLTAIETGREVQSPPREARKTVALIEAILASQAAGNVRVAVDRGLAT